jgi:hypothetical protein
MGTKNPDVESKQENKSWEKESKSQNLGGRDQEDRGLKPAQANSSQDPILKIPNTKKGLVK